MLRAHILWAIGTLITSLGNRTARKYTARHDRDYGAHSWTGR